MGTKLIRILEFYDEIYIHQNMIITINFELLHKNTYIIIFFSQNQPFDILLLHTFVQLNIAKFQIVKLSDKPTTVWIIEVLL